MASHDDLSIIHDWTCCQTLTCGSQISHAWDMQIAECLVSCSLPLTDLTQQLHQLYCRDDGEAAVPEAAIRNCILELAIRRSFASSSSECSRTANKNRVLAELLATVALVQPVGTAGRQAVTLPRSKKGH